MAMSAPEKLTQTILKVTRYMVAEWDLNIHEVLGSLELARLEIWNQWDSDTMPVDPDEEEDDDDALPPNFGNTPE